MAEGPQTQNIFTGSLDSTRINYENLAIRIYIIQNNTDVFNIFPFSAKCAHHDHFKNFQKYTGLKKMKIILRKLIDYCEEPPLTKGGLNMMMDGIDKSSKERIFLIHMGLFVAAATEHIPPILCRNYKLDVALRTSVCVVCLCIPSYFF